MRIVKSAVSFALLIFSLGIVGTTKTGSLYPWIIIGAGGGLAAIMITLVFDLDWRSFVVLLGSVMILAVLYRVYIYTFPSTLVGIDPHDFAIWLEQILKSNSLESNSAPGFYINAPFYLVLSAIGSQITGYNASMAFILISIIIGIGTALWGAVIVKQCNSEYVFNSVLAAAIASGFIAASIHTGFWPIPQSLAAIYFLSFIYTLIKYLQESRSKHLVLCVFFLTALTATHKLALIVVVAALIYIIPLTMLFSYRNKIPNRVSTSIIGVGLLSIVFLYAQMSSTGYIVSIAYRVIGFFGTSVRIEKVSAIAAVPPMDPFYMSLLSVGYALILMALSGVAWIILFTHHPKREHVVLLGTAAGIVSLGVLGMVAGEFGFKRIMDYGGVILVALSLVAINTYYKWRTIKVPKSIVIIGLVTVLLVSSLGSPAATPDYNNYPRNYLTAAESQAVEFANSHAAGEIHSDYLTTRVGSPAGLPANQRTPSYQTTDRKHFNGEIVDGEYVLYRPTVDVYDTGPLSTEASAYRLTWNPEMEYNRIYHRTYSSGEGIIYMNRTNLSEH